MSNAAIRVEGLGKSYLISHEAQRERYTALRDVIVSGVRRAAADLRDRLTMRYVASGPMTEEFWALKNIDFDIAHGEVVGIIGRNGAGKSTLLKILSRITEPGTGRVTIDGRVASLLEVGTGFHPELTGRENIYLNGAILGMSRTEIANKFDEIVDFAEVERFLDTPVKRYSSGMYVRLAFAVAAHLEPDILVIDEVLAVGDIEFQKKCLGKMESVAGRGRTVIFVSHNMAAIQTLCSRSILLSGGELVFDGKTSAAVEIYIDRTRNRTFSRSQANKPIYVANVDEVAVTGGSGDNSLELSFDVKICSDLQISINADVRVKNHMGAPIVFATLGNDRLQTPIILKKGINNFRFSLGVSALVIGEYRLSIDLSTPFVEWHDQVDDIASFAIGSEHWSHVIQPTRQEWGFGSVQLSLTAIEK